MRPRRRLLLLWPAGLAAALLSGCGERRGGDGSAADAAATAASAAAAAAPPRELLLQVSLYGPDGDAAPGMRLSATGAAAATSGADGRVRLLLPRGLEGQPVHIRLERDGWVIVNALLMQPRLQAVHAEVPVEVIVCPRDELWRRSVEYHRHAITGLLQRAHQARIDALGRDSAASRRQRAQLDRERDRAAAWLRGWAGQSARWVPERVDGPWEVALRLMLQGDADGALAALDDAAQARDAARHGGLPDRAAQTGLLAAALHLARLDAAAATAQLERLVQQQPQSWQAWNQYAHLQRSGQRLDLARRGYERTLEIARAAKDDDDAAIALLNLGNIDWDEDRLDVARQRYQQALALWQSVGEGQSINAGITLANLGRLQTRMRDPRAARQSLEQALAVYRRVDDEMPGMYLDDRLRIERDLKALPR
ncbi:MAG: tetratricopeptide repeat protein [Rubrivivax sp.]